MFFCKFCGIFKNNFTELLFATASKIQRKSLKIAIDRHDSDSKKMAEFFKAQSSTTASKIQDFKLPRYYNIIIAPKIITKHLRKSIITLADFLKHYY